MLLCTADEEDGYSFELVRDLLLQTLELAKLRLVGPQTLGELGQYLPATYLNGGHPRGTDMTWQRLESTTIDGTLLEGEAACIADPLWLLGRQWQVGEFTGEDAASPLVVEAAFGHAPIYPRPARAARRAAGRSPTALGAPARDGGRARGRAHGPGRAPACRRGRTGAPTRARSPHGAPAGLVERLPDAFPLALAPDDGLDPVGRAELELLARRAPDARAVLADLAAGGAVMAAACPAPMRCSPCSTPGTSGTPAGAPSRPRASASWDPQRMEYRFQVAAGVGRRTPSSSSTPPEYTGGHLDWYAFDVAARWRSRPGRRRRSGPTRRPGAADAGSLRRPGRVALVAGRGRRTSGSATSASAPEDLARVAVAGFGAVFGDDWYLVPCRLPAGVDRPCRHGEGARHASGRSTSSARAPSSTARTASGASSSSPATPPPTPRELQGPALPVAPARAGGRRRDAERAGRGGALLRDEAGNLGWAAELRVESAAGRTIDRAARARAARPPAAARPPTTRGATGSPSRCPTTWCRSSRCARSTTARLYLQRGRIGGGRRGADAPARSDGCSSPSRALLIDDGEVPATGARVTRSWQLARTADGGVVLWVGRRKDAGPPRRSPGLRFDELAPSP